MPNWCQNEIRVCGDTEKVEEFMDFVKSDEQDFDFEKIVPFPNGKEWDYDWCIENWDTKWNACRVEKDFDPKYGDEVEYTFDTAWSPPENIFRVLKEKFKFNDKDSELYVSWFYREDGMEFSGYLQNEV
jgi:hypothetical protein